LFAEIELLLEPQADSTSASAHVSIASVIVLIERTVAPPLFV
jgi:hypothetical protein